MEKIDGILSKQKFKHLDIIQVLHDIQSEFNYLPQDALEYLAKKTHIPLSRIYSVATFYSAFSLVPKGKHLCSVCMGTACHVRGAPAILERIEERRGIKPGMTTPDREFTLETVYCMGACALAPVVVLDGEVHARMTIGKIDAMLEKYAK